MRQVPGVSTAPVVIVGDGRVARHFRRYFDLLECPVHTWSRRASAAPPTEALAPCKTVLVLIHDGAIVAPVRRRKRHGCAVRQEMP